MFYSLEDLCPDQLHCVQEWSLELEEVYALDREGEYDKFSPYRAKLGKKMLLWHGKLKHVMLAVFLFQVENVTIYMWLFLYF